MDGRVKCGGCSSGGGSTPGTLCPQMPHQTLCKEQTDVNYGSEESDVESASRYQTDSIWKDDEVLIPLISRSREIIDEDMLDVNFSAKAVTVADSTTETLMGPSYYDFQWTSILDSQIRSEIGRETFSNNNVGPTTPFVDPYDTFIGIWDQQIMEHIVLETNRYARQLFINNDLQSNSNAPLWSDTTTDELYVYFSLIISMGIVVKGPTEEYWRETRDIFYTPGFKPHMSLNRFQLLSTCLHFNNNEELCVLELETSEAKLFKIQPLLSHLNSKFQKLYNLGQDIVLDESLIQWNSRLDTNQYNKYKDPRVGLKSYELSEPQTGYLWRFEIHAHKSSQKQPSGDPLEEITPAIVLSLIQGLENKGHTLWLDNFYNSPALARKLKSLGFDCVGILRNNRQFVPQAFSSLAKDMRPGQVTGFTSGDVNVMVYKHYQGQLATISTYHGIAVDKIGEYDIPIVVLDYRNTMDMMDKKDQTLYSFQRKRAKIWYKKLFHRLLYASVLNSHILYKNTSSIHTHHSFKESLVQSLFEKHSSFPFVAPAPML